MKARFNLVITKDGVETSKEYTTLKEIAKDLNIEVYIASRINKITENKIKNDRPHPAHKELYEQVKIYNIKQEFNLNIN